MSLSDQIIGLLHDFAKLDICLINSVCNQVPVVRKSSKSSSIQKSAYTLCTNDSGQSLKMFK